MFGLNPVAIYLIVGLLVTNGLSLFAWDVEKNAAQEARENVVACQTKFNLFEQQVETLGEQQQKKADEVIATANSITKETESRYETRLDAMRADYQRLRQQYAKRNSGGGEVRSVPEAASRIDEIAADCLPLAEQAAETTLMLEGLQQWVSEQEEAHG